MLPFPRKRREIRPFIRDLRTRAERLIRRHRKAAIASVASLVVIGGALGIWALSSSSTAPTFVSRASASTTSSTSSKKTVPLPVTGAKRDPMAAARKLHDAKKYAEAVQTFQPLVDDHVEARFWLGESHLALGHTFRGCRQLSMYVDLAPKGAYVKSAKRSLKNC